MTLETLLVVILTWLSITLSLPVTGEHPRVELVPAARMAQVRHSRLVAPQLEPGSRHAARADAAEPGDGVHAVYDDLSRTIYLPEGWNASSAADVSVLVHELVHHVQNVNGLQYTCPAEREKLAYRAQGRWLELFDTTLNDEFGLDPMTLLVRTNCMQ